jgi:diaminopimelate epimerase
MQLNLCKYQGTGNDFILLDNREGKIVLNQMQREFLCNRKFGVGADGLILLENEPGFDFKMIYYNSDGLESSMCGNGGRCISAFANRLGIIENKSKFLAIDGEHISEIKNENVSLQMKNIYSIEKGDGYFFLDTGSPHYVKFVENLENFSVVEEGKKIRNNTRFLKKGTNVNFIERKNEGLWVRTYERGVENETLACGTGVTAACIVAGLTQKSTKKNSCEAITPGGKLFVKFNQVDENTFDNIWLEGPALFVFEAMIKI